MLFVKLFLICFLFVVGRLILYYNETIFPQIETVKVLETVSKKK